jgi:DNA-binding transcriptional ArsR family regulator
MTIAETRPMPEAPKGRSRTTKARKAKPAGEAEQRRKRAQDASVRLKQVSDPTRLSVILMLARGERNVGSLSQELGQSQPAVSHHLALLRHGGLISPRRQGKNNFYSLTAAGGELAKLVQDMMP